MTSPYIKPLPAPTPYSPTNYLSPEDMEHMAEDISHSPKVSAQGPYSIADYMSPEDMDHIAEDHVHHATDDSKVEDPLLNSDKKQNQSASPTISPSKSTFTIDEEKNIAKSRFHKLTPKERHKRALDLAQRIVSFLISLIILAIMARALGTFLANKNVTADGKSIYPTFMKLWPTYVMIAAGAVTVLLNVCIVYWRVRGTLKDLDREEIYSKYWDYALHVVNFVIWAATSSTFVGTKYLGGVEDPNVLWGYVCSDTANQLNEKFPSIVKFSIECQFQNVSFWMTVSEVALEGFALATKVFVKLGVM